jgi:hypothetical protein
MKNTKIETFLIIAAVAVAGIGSYVLLTGHWATPITEWLLMSVR